MTDLRNDLRDCVWSRSAHRVWKQASQPVRTRCQVPTAVAVLMRDWLKDVIWVEVYDLLEGIT